MSRFTSFCPTQACTIPTTRGVIHWTLQPDYTLTCQMSNMHLFGINQCCQVAKLQVFVASPNSAVTASERGDPPLNFPFPLAPDAPKEPAVSIVILDSCKSIQSRSDLAISSCPMGPVADGPAECPSPVSWLRPRTLDRIVWAWLVGSRPAGQPSSIKISTRQKSSCCSQQAATSLAKSVRFLPFPKSSVINHHFWMEGLTCCQYRTHWCSLTPQSRKARSLPPGSSFSEGTSKKKNHKWMVP